MYGVFHEYDEDGGLGYAVAVKDLLFVADSKEVADAYAEKWSNPHEYEHPYDSLFCGTISVEEIRTKPLTKEDLSVPPWELLKGRYSWSWGFSAEKAFNPGFSGEDDDD